MHTHAKTHTYKHLYTQTFKGEGHWLTAVSLLFKLSVAVSEKKYFTLTVTPVRSVDLKVLVIDTYDCVLFLRGNRSTHDSEEGPE